MLRKRYQKGSLKKRCGKWIGQWREGDKRKNRALGPVSTMRKSDARRELDKILAGINVSQDNPEAPTVFGAFITESYFPYYARKWKASTTGENRNRVTIHLVSEFSERELRGIKRDELQDVLDARAADGFSFSVVDHLRWDLRQIFAMAVAEGIVPRNPAELLYTPREAKTPVHRVMTFEEVQQCFTALDRRERLIAKLAILAGMRPGEIFALTWDRLKGDRAEIVQRLYRGKIDSPKTKKSIRTVALPDGVGPEIEAWREFCPLQSGDAWVFPSETLKTPISRDSCWRRHIGPKLSAVGLEWATFQVMRRTHSSLMNGLGISGKLVADQLGHSLDVNQNVYTQSPIAARREAVNRLEETLAGI